MSTNAGAYELAAYLDGAESSDGITLGVSDAELAAKALRRLARRGRVLAGVAKFALATAFLSVGIGVVSGESVVPAFAFDMNGDGIVDAADAHSLIDRVSFGRHAADPAHGNTITRLIETKKGVFRATLAETASPFTDYRLVDMVPVADPEQEVARMTGGVRIQAASAAGAALNVQ